MPDYATFKLTVSVLTPVHIGSGRELLNEYDYAIHGGQTWRINDSALLEAQDVDDPAIAERLAEVPPAQLLKDEDYVPGSRYFRYVIRGTPRSKAAGAQLHEQLKDTFDRPYLPGSSLKGALRTVLAWHAWGALGMRPDAKELKPSAKFAAQNIEHKLFVQEETRPGHEPNYDLLRALHLSDSQPLGADALVLVNASVLNRAGLLSKIPVEVEALRANVECELRMKLDLALFSDWAKQYGLRLTGEEWLRRLPELCREHARQRIQQEIAWFRSIPSANRLLSAYQQIAQVQLAGNQFLLQLGWGTGWDDKTLGSRLSSDPQFIEMIIGRYNMARGKRSKGEPFPKSRRAVMSASQSPQGQKVEAPAVPLGWVLISMEPEHGSTHWLEISQKTEILLKLQGTQSPSSPPTTKTEATGYEASVAKAPSKKLPGTQDVQHPEKAEPAMFIAHFSGLPQGGQRFEGKVIDNEANGTILLEIPGLSANDLAMALIAPQDNPDKRRYKEGAKVSCEVLSLAEEKNNPGYWLVKCRKI